MTNAPGHRFGEEIVALLPRLRRFAIGLAGNEDDGDDLVQAACERALIRRGQWREGTRLDSWMFRIIQTLWIDRGRADRVRGRHMQPVDPDSQIGSDGERLVEARLTLDAVQRAFSALSDEQRVVLLLVCVEGYSYRESAEITGMPMGTVISRVARGRMALSRLVEGGERFAGGVAGTR